MRQFLEDYSPQSHRGTEKKTEEQERVEDSLELRGQHSSPVYSFLSSFLSVPL
jgi:hypothetical protein